jgi:hypothetical protein
VFFRGTADIEATANHQCLKIYNRKNSARNGGAFQCLDVSGLARYNLGELCSGTYWVNSCRVGEMVTSPALKCCCKQIECSDVLV